MPTNSAAAPDLLVLAGGMQPLDFDRNPGFLVGRLSRRTALDLDRRVRPFGVTFAQAALLARLWQRSGLSQSQLQEEVGVDASTMTGLLQRLGRLRLIRRRRDRRDSRIQRVYLTDRGRELFPRLNVEAEATTARLLSGFSQAEADQLCDLLRRALANFETTS
jgi:DNA-binding MarR family transcriptional regulator